MNARTTKILRSGLTGKTAKPGLRTTLASSNWPLVQTQGFTLVEVLIAMAIIVLVITMGVPALSRVTYQRVNSTARKFVGLSRTIRNDAILLSRVHRLVIDFEHAAYWVEQQKQAKLIEEETEESRKKREEKRKKDLKDGKDSSDSNFTPVEKYSKKPITLSEGVVFDGVFKEKEGLIKEGLAYIHFFPSGFVEQSAIYLNKAGASSPGLSIVLRSNAGRVDIEPRYVQHFEE